MAADKTIRGRCADLGFDLTDEQVVIVAAILRGETLVHRPRRVGGSYALRAAVALAENDVKTGEQS